MRRLFFQRRGPHTPGAFTLIEVLIGILILAIALLGLGAVVPVVVRAQRQATDATQGLIAAASAEAYLRGSRELNRLTQLVPPTTLVRAGFGVWLLDPNWSRPGTFSDSYLWEPLTNLELDPLTGRMLLQNSPNAPAMIHVADRLWPARNSGSVAPQYVWDFVGRRVATSPNEPERIQLAVFVRRIDLNIRVPSGLAPGPAPQQPWSVYDVITASAGLPAGAARVAVAVDTTAGYPTNTGVGNYSGIRAIDADFLPNNRDRLLLAATPAAELVLAKQIGQRLVDNLGNVYTVRGVWEGDVSGRTVLIDPPVPGGVQSNASGGLQGAGPLYTFRQVVFTPQVPAAVSVMEFIPLDAK